jgi:hypothetical protein
MTNIQVKHTKASIRNCKGREENGIRDKHGWEGESLAGKHKKTCVNGVGQFG